MSRSLHDYCRPSLPQEPYPMRFRTAEDGQEYLKSYAARKPDPSKAIPPIIQEGNKLSINPEWSSAPFELTYIL